VRLVDHLVRVQLLGLTSDGQAVSNTWHFRTDEATPNLAKLQGFVDGFITSEEEDNYLALMPTVDRLQRVTASQVVIPLTGDDVPIEASSFPDHTGTGGTGPFDLPDEACCLLSLHTGFASRRARGHNFLPPPREKAMLATEGGVWKSTNYFARCQDFSNGIDANWLEGTEHAAYVEGMDLCVFSRTAAMANAEVDQYAFKVTNTSVHNHVHWLRSRSAAHP